MKKSSNNQVSKIDYLLAIRTLAIRNARKKFWTFCHLVYPDFYKDDRLYLKDLCNTLQDFYQGKIDKKILVINMPPRHGKTFTARLFVLWMFGQDSKTKIMTGSYNQILSSLFAQQTRDGIMVDNESLKSEYFTDIFPEVRIKQGDAAKGFWSLDGSEEKNYLATSPSGTSTGVGAHYVIVDDIIKNKEEAYNENILNSHWEWYNNTLVQRMEKPRKQILIMTRWASGDLAGRMMERRKDSVHQIMYKAVQDDGSMLCEEIMTYDDYLDVIQEMNEDIASANYQQEPIDLKGCLYQSLKTYDHLPIDANGHSLLEGTYAYTDTADEGADYLCTIIWSMYNHDAYVRDIIYTQDSMEITEPLVAERLTRYEVNQARFESNSGGRGFARNVSDIMESLKNFMTDVTWFHQSKNKKARILANSTQVQTRIFFPSNYRDKWPEYAKAMHKYQKEGKNAHDDAPDATTGVIETILLGGL